MSYTADRLLDVYVYALVVGAVQGLLTLAVLAFVTIVGLRRGWRVYLRHVAHVLIFSSSLYVVGCVANSLWMLLAYERWYVSADTVVDFWPFLPFGQWVLDVSFGGVRGQLLNGARLWQLQGLWLLLATATWLVSLRIYRRLVNGEWFVAQPLVAADAPKAAGR